MKNIHVNIVIKNVRIYSLRQHEIRCKLNPNRINMDYIKPGNSKGHKGTNQFIKAKELGLPKPIVSDETNEKIANVWKNKKHSIESKKINSKYN